jgi:hypothetical protein
MPLRRVITSPEFVGAGRTLPMEIRRAMPVIVTEDPAAARVFYESFLGFRVAMDEDGMIMFASRSTPTTSATPPEGSSILPATSLDSGSTDRLGTKLLEMTRSRLTTKPCRR